MPPKILIIGSQGYLGTRLVDYLSKRNFTCYTLDTGFFKNGLIHKPLISNCIHKDARDVLIDDLKGYSSVVMLAGISNDPFGDMDPKKIYNPTVNYTLKIARMCKVLKIQFIFPSSCSVYGAAGKKMLSEGGEVNPQTDYSKNKLQIEKGLQDISDKNFTPIALRFATIYGMSPRIRFDVVVNMLCGLALTQNKIKLNSNGLAWRPNLHIDDACEVIKHCIQSRIKEKGLIILNVGQDCDNYKIIDIANLIKTYLPNITIEYLNKEHSSEENELIKDKKIQDGVDTRTYRVSFKKIKILFPSLKFSWNLELGIKDLINKLKKNEITTELFNQRDFYRLQQIEYLYNNKFINDDLRWININGYEK